MSKTVSLTKDEFDDLVMKANLFEHYIETEELTREELGEIKKALKGPFLTKHAFLKRHPHLS